MPGGFVGVDVFFVISGYLITSIILEDIKTGRFSLVQFYERRARRILPALFVVVLASSILAWLVAAPADMFNYSQSLIGVSVFASNLFFWRTSGYFDSATDLKPLIHTWSLAVEEQYYVLFPLFMLLARKWMTWRAIGVLALAAVASMAGAQWGSSRFPAAAFYLLPTRAWELLLGVFVAYYFSIQPSRKHDHHVAEAGGILGVAMILCSVFGFSDRTPFPSVFALLPTVGAALIILFTNPTTLAGKALSSRGFVFIGLISYSAYLWHQPLLALGRQRALGELGYLALSLILISSFLLAYCTWRVVERPFRNRHVFSRSQIFTFGCFGSMLFIAIGVFGYSTKGVMGRYEPTQRDFLQFFENSIPELAYFKRENVLENYREQCDFYNLDAYRAGNATTIPKSAIAEECHKPDGRHRKTVFIWGDSHAQHLYPGLKRTLPADWQILQVTTSGCAPSLDGVDSAFDYCRKSNWFALKRIRELVPDVVIIGQNRGHEAGVMTSVAQELRSLGVKKVIFAGPTPHWKVSLPIIVATKLWADTPEFSEVGLDRKLVEYDRTLKAVFEKRDDLRYVSIIDYFCSPAGCRVYFDGDRKTGITSWDFGHLTLTASTHFASDVLVPLVIGP